MVVSQMLAIAASCLVGTVAGSLLVTAGHAVVRRVRRRRAQKRAQERVRQLLLAYQAMPAPQPSSLTVHELATGQLRKSKPSWW